jgi:hypothetical protein
VQLNNGGNNNSGGNNNRGGQAGNAFGGRCYQHGGRD